MALAAGARLGPHEVLSALGAGGMGEVYRARDTKLGRDVALKILPESFTHDQDRVARFRREAQVLAALNHPHIGAIYGLDEANGQQFLVLELIDGETLADRLRRGPLPVDEALAIARQIAEALEAAHEKGIIHRDLKPANVALTEDGRVKVLDFGLAKATEAGSGTSVDLANSPTLTSPAMMTGVGMILGTAAYMSPEQAKGKPADKRADVWAFGCVLYEMLTAKRAFEGEDVSDTLAAVLRGQPDWTAFPETAPPGIVTLVKRCLEKDRKARIADVSTLRYVLDDVASAATTARATTREARPAGMRRVLPWVAAGALGLALALVLVLWPPWRKSAVPSPLRLSADLGVGTSVLIPTLGASIVLSPDGALLAFVAQKPDGGAAQLFVRRLEQLHATPLSGTVEASQPFFSPDGQWIAFFTPGKLNKISVNGGAVITLCDAPSGRGGSWAEDGTIVFSPINGAGVSLWRVSSTGGAPESLTTLDRSEETQRWPQVLPRGRAVLYTSHSTIGDYESANLVVQPLPTGPRKVVQRGGYFGRYLPSGHMIYLHGGTLFVAPFDLTRLEPTGPPVPVLEGIATNAQAGAALFAASDSGALAYVAGRQSGSNNSPIDWVDHAGKPSPLRTTPANWSNLQFSPDGRRLALDIYDGKQWDVWIDDWERDTLSRLTVDAAHDVKPVWTPDGRRIVYASMRDAKTTYNLYWQRADGTGDVQRLTNAKNPQFPGSWHPSGKVLAFEEQNPSQFSLMLLPMEGDEGSGWRPGKATVFLASPFDEREPKFSPDGRWLAYFSNESGQYEVYVRPFPARGGKVQISSGGGVFPTWSRTRRELFYGTGDQRIMMATYTAEGESFHAEKPRLWSEARYRTRAGTFMAGSFDLHPDGDRFALATSGQAPIAPREDRIVFVLNFFDELRRIAPTTRR